MEYNKNDLLTVTIEDMGNDGEGIGKIEGYTLFIKDAVMGDTVSCKIMKAKKNYAYARLEKVLIPSSFRVEPRCHFHRQCGGCQIQTLDYEAQLRWKQNKIKNHLTRIGGFAESYIDQVMDPIVGMEEPFHYRNKAQYPVGTGREGEPVTGFYAGRTHDIIPNTRCLLGAKTNQEILEEVLSYMKENKISAYDEKTGKGLIRHILIRTGFTSGEVMVCLVVNTVLRRGGKEILPAQQNLIDRLKVLPGMTGICVNGNTERTNVILGKEVEVLWGEARIKDTIHVRNTSDFSETGEEIAFHISPLSFYQVNPRQTEKLYSLALEYADLKGDEVVWDLYCGIGTISLFLALRAGKVMGVEIVPEAIEDARENAAFNHIENAEFYVGRAENILPEMYEKDGVHANVIVVDPPRKGCDIACLETMLLMKPEKIIYVSCDSATLARDLKVLCDGGYEIKKVRGVDQFGQTVHVETVALLERKAQ